MIGRGSFGVLYLGISKIDKLHYALKFLISISSNSHIITEVRALQMLGKHSNVIELLAYVRHLDQIVLVFPYFPHDKFKHLICHFTVENMRVYIYQLLSALSYVHSHGIIHRDVNPSNYLFNRELGRGKLIDFGLVQLNSKPPKIQKYIRNSSSAPMKCSHPASCMCTTCLGRKEKKAPRSGTPGYRAPEVLLKYCHQTSAIDVWSCGVILLSLLSKKYPFFTANDDSAALAEIVGIFGVSKSTHAANEIGISLTISECIEEVDIKTLCTCEGECNDLIALVSALLDVNCLTRISAAQALHIIIHLISVMIVII